MATRTTIVTGGTGGLGTGVVRSLAASGHRVLATWIDERELAPAEEAFHGHPVELRRLDVLDEEAVAALVGEVDGGSGLRGVAHLVGGYLDGRPFGETSLRDLEGQLALNLRSLAVVLGAALPRLAARGEGRVVAVGARAALRPWAGASAYAASKAGVVAMVQAAQGEVLGDGVCVNCVLPSVIDTPANRDAMPDVDPATWVSPGELGAVIAFLMSDAASAVTGAAIPVYGRA
jgi:NAD(P)-dependent dehydrogenase (short-subunit alcohol dehydrogenase family)